MTAALKTETVSKIYGKGNNAVTAVDQVSIEIKSGETVRSDAFAAIEHYLKGEVVEAAFENLNLYWEQLLEVLAVLV